MHLRVSFLSVSLVVSSLVLSSQAQPWKRPNGVSKDTTATADGSTDGLIGDVFDDSDFEDVEDDDSEEPLIGFDGEKMNSVTHLRRDGGQILVPCFGMWWPVGGVSYDYIGDYYGDYKKKKRRSRKQKKAAKMKKKKI